MGVGGDGGKERSNLSLNTCPLSPCCHHQWHSKQRARCLKTACVPLRFCRHLGSFSVTQVHDKPQYRSWHSFLILSEQNILQIQALCTHPTCTLSPSLSCPRSQPPTAAEPMNHRVLLMESDSEEECLGGSKERILSSQPGGRSETDRAEGRQRRVPSNGPAVIADRSL